MDAVPPPTPESLAQRPEWWARHAPAVLLVALAITIPELLTGSTPVFNLVNPIAVLGLLGLYGAGVLLIREAAIRWQKGWGTILALGVAYGIVEEGIAVKTFFNTNSHVVGYLGTFGHWAGVNWVWAVELGLFHAIFSIALPILIVGLAYPELRGSSFVSNSGLRWLVAAFTVTVAFMAVAFTPQAFPGVPVYLATAGAVAGFVLLGRWLRADALRPATRPPRFGPRGMFLLGTGFTFAFFGVAWPLPYVLPSPVAVIVVFLALVAGLAIAARAGLGTLVLPSNETAFAGGLVVFLFVLSAVMALGGDFGAPVVAALLATLLVVIYRARRAEEGRGALGRGAPEPVTPGNRDVPVPPGASGPPGW